MQPAYNPADHTAEFAPDDISKNKVVAMAAYMLGVVGIVIALLAAGVSVFLIPWIKSKTTDAQRKELLEWVKIGVAAAEQLYEGQGRGEEKKKYVLEFLASMGFTVDEEAVNAAIEAAVNQLNGGNLPLE